MTAIQTDVPLTGGRTGEIRRRGDAVIRPAQAWTIHIHGFLRYMREQGADFVPEPLGINENGEEILSYLPGVVYNEALPEALLGEATLVSAAKLLRRFHDGGAPYITQLTGREAWMLPAAQPAEVMCHGDFAPYNVTITGDMAFGLIDFDTLHPGPRLEDIAYAVYRWAVPNDEPNPFDKPDRITRARLFMDAYGTSPEARHGFVSALVKRLEALTAFMRAEAEKGSVNFRQNIEDGHLCRYENDISHIKKRADTITRGLI